MPDSFGSAGVALQFVGMISSAVGAHDAAVSQKMAISAQAQMDKINARSSALAMNGQADLELINQKAGFEAMSFNSSMNTLNTEAHIFDAKSGASLNMLGAENSAAMTTLQAGTQASLTLTNAYSKSAISAIQSGMQTDALEVGAHMADQNANLMELQAQSTLLHGEYREQDSRMQYAQAKSRATVQMARGNLDMSEGTPLQVKVGIDVMSERAAIMIQQDTLMQAFGQRTQASNSLMDAGIKRAQAQSITSMTAIQNSTDIKMAETQAATGIKLGDMAAASTLQQAALKTALTDMNSEFEMHTAQSQSDWTAAMSHAGMLNAEAAAAYKHTMATVLETNSAASAAVKQAMADGISPNMAFLSSVLGSAGQVANSWYTMNKVGS
jgi:hypothetical protein